MTCLVDGILLEDAQYVSSIQSKVSKTTGTDFRVQAGRSSIQKGFGDGDISNSARYYHFFSEEMRDNTEENQWRF